MSSLRTACLSALTVIASLLTTSARAQSPPSFRAELVGGALTSTASVTGVTDQGLVCGTLSDSGTGRAFVADLGSGVVLLPLPAGAMSSSAADINENGLVVGSVNTANMLSAVVWTPTPSGYVVTSIPPVGGAAPYQAFGCNDRGDVVGRFQLGQPMHWSVESGTTNLWTEHGLGWQLQDVNESRLGVGGSVRFDLDDSSTEELGVPTGTGSSYGWVMLSSINDGGTVGGYAHTSTSQSNAFEAIRYHDAQGWKAFNVPIPQASVLAIDAADDTLYQLFYDGSPRLHVDGLGGFQLEALIDASTPGWVLSGYGVMSRSGRLAAKAYNPGTGESGIVLLTRLPFDDLGGSTPGITGRPVLRGEGTLAAGAPVALRLLNARPLAPVALLVSVGSAPLPFKGGTLHASEPALLVWGSSDAQGRVALSEQWPDLPSGTSLVLQYGVVDASGPFGAALSNGLAGVTP